MFAPRALPLLLALFAAVAAFSATPAGYAAEVPAAAKIVAVDGTPTARRLAIRVERRLAEKELKDLAQSLSAARKGEQVASINVYVGNSALAEDPWATVRLGASTPQISILGLRAEEEAAFRAEAERDTRDVVGSWLTSPPALPGKLSIIRLDKGRLVAEWHLRSGQKTTDDLTMMRVSRGYRYDVVGGDGAYYLATWGGPLQLGDATRVIATAEKLVLEKPAPKVAAPAAAATSRPQPMPVVADSVPSSSQDAAVAARIPTPATGATSGLKSANATAEAAAAVVAPDAARKASRARRDREAARKARSSVADLMTGAQAR